MIAIIALITNSFLRRFSIRKTSREGFWFDGLSASMSMILWKKRFFSNLLDDDDDYERNRFSMHGEMTWTTEGQERKEL